MENKYYVPSIEEFRVGFECEMNTAPMNWKHARITLNHFKHVDKWLKEETIRVKYIDKEDVESLGFKEMERTVESVAYSKGNYGEYTLAILRGLKEIMIMRYGFSLFRGAIKNVSELKTLLTQLGVDYE